MNNIETLPLEIFISILEYLPWKELLIVETVSKFFLNIIQTETWKSHHIKLYPYFISKLLSNHNFVSYDFTSMYPSDRDIINLVKTLREKNLKLHHLNLHNCTQITEKVFEYLIDCIELNLERIDMIDPYAYKSCYYFSNCKKLNLSKSLIEDSELQYLTNCLELDISGCTKITDDGLKWLNHCQKLNLSHCNVSVTGLSKLISCTDLNLSWCMKVNETIDQWSIIAKKLSKLKKLNLTGITLNDQVLSYFVDLNELNLSWCSGITNIGVSQLRCPIIKIYQCKNISSIIIEMLKPIGSVVKYIY